MVISYEFLLFKARTLMRDPTFDFVSSIRATHDQKISAPFPTATSIDQTGASLIAAPLLKSLKALVAGGWSACSMW
jgi:hypothetical protein